MNTLGYWGPDDWATFHEIFRRLDRVLFKFVPAPYGRANVLDPEDGILNGLPVGQ